MHLNRQSPAVLDKNRAVRSALLQAVAVENTRERKIALLKEPQRAAVASCERIECRGHLTMQLGVFDGRPPDPEAVPVEHVFIGVAELVPRTNLKLDLYTCADEPVLAL